MRTMVEDEEWDTGLDGERVEGYDEGILATRILCGTIGLAEHFRMGLVRTLAAQLNVDAKELIELAGFEFIPHCECVREWLKGL